MHNVNSLYHFDARLTSSAFARSGCRENLQGDAVIWRVKSTLNTVIYTSRMAVAENCTHERAVSQWLCSAGMDAEDQLQRQEFVATLTTDEHPHQCCADRLRLKACGK